MSEYTVNKDVKPEAEVVEAPVEVEETAVVEESPVIEKPSAPAKNAVVVEDEIKESPGLAPVENGAIGSTTVKSKKSEPKKVETPAKPTDTVVLKSTKNVVWQGVGKVSRGINVVSKDEAEHWLTRSHITLLTPEEVAKEYNR